MFTGIVTDLGTLVSVKPGRNLKRLRIESRYPLRSIALGASISATASAQTATVQKAGDVTVIRQQDAAATLVHASCIIRDGLDRQTLTQNGLAALTAQTVLRTPIDGKPVQDAIAAHGGSIEAFVDPGDVRFAIEALPQDADAVFSLAQQAISHPAFDSKTIDAARTTLTSEIATNR